MDICALGDDNVDTDGDGTPDACDACPVDPENDGDGDGICEVDDNCDLTPNPDQQNLDGDGAGDACDPDDDNDGVDDLVDNGPLDANSDQSDADGDGLGDVCDPSTVLDEDGDGVLDTEDLCGGTEPGAIVDGAGCSIGQICPCDNPWKNHGAYVACVAHASEEFLDAGLISQEEKDAVVSASGSSSCGHKKK